MHKSHGGTRRKRQDEQEDAPTKKRQSRLPVSPVAIPVRAQSYEQGIPTPPPFSIPPTLDMRLYVTDNNDANNDTPGASVRTGVEPLVDSADTVVNSGGDSAAIGVVDNAATADSAAPGGDSGAATADSDVTTTGDSAARSLLLSATHPMLPGVQLPTVGVVAGAEGPAVVADGKALAGLRPLEEAMCSHLCQLLAPGNTGWVGDNSNLCALAEVLLSTKDMMSSRANGDKWAAAYGNAAGACQQLPPGPQSLLLTALYEIGRQRAIHMT
eukprot:gb/GEZN01014761.1/.p1 GENE.gb/GEZN01014761.1/~~gb/GEZN01014761.1/.p1  ORF type:complete len:270 (+),score=52.38 gb/GEZN01014761.1/:67-876(+)